MKTLAFAFLLFATPTFIEIDTTTLTAPRMWEVGNRRVTAEKAGDTTIVRVAEGDRIDTVQIRYVDGKRQITRSDNGVPRPFLFIDRAHVLVDGMDIEPFLTGDGAITEAPPKKKYAPEPGAYRFYVCPKDQAVLRVLPTVPEKTFTCPVDGTVMKSGVGPGRKYWLLD
jgi:hypothetical protein